MSTDRARTLIIAALVAAVLVLGWLTIVNLSSQSAQNRQIVALANAHHADSDRIAAKVDQISCQRTIVTRAGLVTFFTAAAKDRALAERQESDPRAAALDAALVKADLLAARQERSAGCNGTFPDGGSG